MDNRWRFLYCMVTELWGRMWGAGAGKGEPGTSAAGVMQANPHHEPRALRGPKESREARSTCAEKSRYRLPCTRTVNRHRWMRRES